MANATSPQGKVIPAEALGFQEVEIPRFQDNRHMKVVRLSALRTGRLYTPGYSWYSFLLEAESTQGHSEAGRIMSMKNYNDAIGNQTRDLSACSAAPLAKAPHHAYKLLIRVGSKFIK